MPRPVAELVKPHDGDWIFVSPPEGFEHDINERQGTGESVFDARHLSSIAVASVAYLEVHPGHEAITLLSPLTMIPHPGQESDAGRCERDLAKGVEIIGYCALEKYGFDLDRMAANRDELVEGILPSPAAVFAESAELRERTIASQEALPGGMVYVTAGRTVPGALSALAIGWCDPTDGRRSEVHLSMAIPPPEPVV